MWLDCVDFHRFVTHTTTTTTYTHYKLVIRIEFRILFSEKKIFVFFCLFVYLSVCLYGCMSCCFLISSNRLMWWSIKSPAKQQHVNIQPKILVIKYEKKKFFFLGKYKSNMNHFIWPDFIFFFFDDLSFF